MTASAFGMPTGDEVAERNRWHGHNIMLSPPGETTLMARMRCGHSRTYIMSESCMMHMFDFEPPFLMGRPCYCLHLGDVERDR